MARKTPKDQFQACLIQGSAEGFELNSWGPLDNIFYAKFFGLIPGKNDDKALTTLPTLKKWAKATGPPVPRKGHNGTWWHLRVVQQDAGETLSVSDAKATKSIVKRATAPKEPKAPKVSSTEKLKGLPQDQLLDMFDRGGKNYAVDKGGGLVWDEVCDNAHGECYRIHDGFAMGHYIKTAKVRERLHACGAVHVEGHAWWLIPKGNPASYSVELEATYSFFGLNPNVEGRFGERETALQAHWPCRM